MRFFRRGFDLLLPYFQGSTNVKPIFGIALPRVMLSFFMRGGAPWRMGHCWRIPTQGDASVPSTHPPFQRPRRGHWLGRVFGRAGVERGGVGTLAVALGWGGGPLLSPPRRFIYYALPHSNIAHQSPSTRAIWHRQVRQPTTHA
jgi:hypothetical protein